MPLLTTKLFVPPARAALVPRPRLTALITDALTRPLTLISAPAGSGKTTLLSEWVACDPGHADTLAWLSLDLSDNDEVRFLTYLIAAVARLRPGFGDAPAAWLHAPQPPATATVLAHLIGALSALDSPIALVLDDYHCITAASVHAGVAYLLDHLPAQAHLIILTRADPPLRLARLRARAQLTEVRAADLRFTAEEAATFLNQVMGLTLSAQDVATLAERTEGWIAGLQLAALSMKGRDCASFIKAFAGSHVYVAEYLVEEVLSQQPEEARRFLLQTSILDRLSAELCQAITAQAGCQDMLQHLFSGNLFLIALDDHQGWYRYHHLFADLLRVKLDQRHPGLAPQLHARAAAWLEHEGLIVEAVRHALAAGEHAQAARLVEANTTSLLARGELTALMTWIGALPADVRQARPWLCIHQAYALAFAGRLAEVPALLDQAAGTLAGGLPAGTEARTLQGAIAAVRAMVAVMTGRETEALTFGYQARELLPSVNLWDRAAAAWALGYAQRSLGHLTEARAAFEEQITLGRAMSNIWTLVTGLTDLAQVLRVQGQLRQAKALFEQALTAAGQQGARSLGYMARMEAGLASVLYEHNELAAAQQLLAEARAHGQQWPNPNHLAYAHALQARLDLAQGDLQAARLAIGEADRIRTGATLTRLNRRMVEVDSVRVWRALNAADTGLAQQDSLAERADTFMAGWRAELAQSADLDESAEGAAIGWARTLLTAGRADEALALLACVTQQAQAAGRTGGAIVALILTALARQRCLVGPEPRTGQAAPTAALEEALALAEPGGYVRAFLDEGRPLQLLLAQWLARVGPHPSRAYASRLLAAFESEPQAAAAVLSRTVSPSGGPVEPLSPREMEVLHLIAQGTTNAQIAHQLTVATGTIKAHTASIYRKLDVANRTEAVTRARQLRLLP